MKHNWPLRIPVRHASPPRKAILIAVLITLAASDGVAQVCPVGPGETAVPGCPNLWFFEVDADYGETLGNTNLFHPSYEIGQQIGPEFVDTYAPELGADCLNWQKSGAPNGAVPSPYMGPEYYVAECTVAAGDQSRTEQMITDEWKPGPDSARHLSLAFRLRDMAPLSIVVPGARGFITQLHQDPNSLIPFRLQWYEREGAYYLQATGRYNRRDAGACDEGSFSFEEPLEPDTWYRMLFYIDLGPSLEDLVPGDQWPPKMEHLPGHQSTFNAYLMDNATGLWESLYTYEGRLGFHFKKGTGCDSRDDLVDVSRFEWKVGQYVVDFEAHKTDYDNVAIGMRSDDISKKKLIGHQKSVFRIGFDVLGSGKDDLSWEWNNGAQGDPVRDYNNDAAMITTPSNLRGNYSHVGTNVLNGAKSIGLNMYYTDRFSYLKTAGLWGPDKREEFDFGNYVSSAVWFRRPIGCAAEANNMGLVIVDEGSNSSWKVLTYMSDTNLSFGVRHPSDTVNGHDFYSKINVLVNNSYCDGEWHHVVGTFNRFAADGKRIKLYFDGGESVCADDPEMAAGTGSWCAELPGYDLPILRGERNVTVGKWGSSYFKGYVDEVNIFNFALTQAQVEDLYLGSGAP